MSLDLLKKSLYAAPVIKKGDYEYLIHPITDGVPSVSPELLKEISTEMKILLRKCGTIDRIVTIEAMGIPLATALSLDMNIPFTIIRKRQYHLPDEVSVEQKTGYSKSTLFINGLKKDDRIVIVDDVISTGGTLRAVLSILKKMDVQVKGVFIAINKGVHSQEISNEFHVQIASLINIDIIDGKIKILA